MKIVTTFVMLCALWLNVIAQAPEKMSYQAVVRNTAGDLVKDHTVGMKVSILQGSPTGTMVFQELYNPNPQTNANGLVSIEIGTGIPLTGTFSGIDWSSGPFYLKTETDPTGGTNYVISGTSQLLSVPYALYAKTAGASPPWSQFGSNIYYNNGNVGIGVSDPVSNLDIRGKNRDDSGIMMLGNSDLSHRMRFFGGRENNPNPFIQWKQGDPLRFSTDEGGWSEKMRINSDGNVGIGTTTPLYLLHVNGKTLIENSRIGNIIELNQEGIGNRHTFIDFHSDDEYTDYGLRIIRFNTGPDTNSEILHRGQGGLKLITQDAAPIHFSTSNTNRMTISSDGNVVMANQNIKNLANPVDNQDAATKAYVDALKQQIKTLEDNLIATGDYKLQDVEGNQYNVVKIGSQVWMAENLRTGKYNDDAYIPLVTDNTAWANLTTPGYCWYNNEKATYGNIYGALYNWFTINTGKLCPTGWHVPSDEEWTTLTTFLGGESVAGGKMKEAGTTHWITPNTGATNESGFSALPGGFRTGNGDFGGIGKYGYWWSSTESSTDLAWGRGVYYTNASVGRNSFDKDDGFSVRCVRDL